MDHYPQARHLLDAPDKYRILIRGTLDADWAGRLGGMTVSATRLADGTPTTTLIGDLADQSALVGVLNTLHDLGIPLIKMERVGAAAEDRPASLPAEQQD
jgi:hypothetical protein